MYKGCGPSVEEKKKLFFAVFIRLELSLLITFTDFHVLCLMILIEFSLNCPRCPFSERVNFLADSLQQKDFLVRQLTSPGLVEAGNMAETADAKVLEAVGKDVANDAAAKLKEADAEVAVL